VSLRAADELRRRRYWIFDLDGTLTVAVHDFDAIRAALALPAGKPILEALEALPPAEAAARYQRLDAIERELSARAAAQAGARELLAALERRGTRLGVLTRNSEQVALETLARCGLAGFFDPAWVIGRESATPKPDPEGILRLLARWSAPPASAVMVGDFRFDLEAGAGAGVLTVYVDVERRREWSHLAHYSVHALDELRALLDRHDADRA